jgi:hypothetical protein
MLKFQQDYETEDTPQLRVVETAPNTNAATIAELRQAMYARIARGQALEEAESQAQRKWTGKR